MTRFASILSVAAILMSCNRPSAPDCFKSAGKAGEEVRVFNADITRLEINDLIEVELVSDSLPYAKIIGPENLLNEIESEFSNGTLSLSNTSTCNWVRDLGIRMKVVVAAPMLEGLVYRGQGDVLFRDTVKTAFLSCEVRNGAGDLFIRHAGDSLDVYVHTGVSAIQIEGYGNKAKFFNQGIGVFDASNYRGNVLLTNNNSINNMHLRVSDYLFARIGARGNTYYKGDPGNVDVDRVGEGQLFQVD
ncbi:MAG: hypothetical protein GC193_04700 [Cryomorphaceae bacterium]|nr:hypothetical protein [Cryomorphaceae bacterium]